LNGAEIAIAIGVGAVIWTGGILLLGMWLGYDRGYDHATEEQAWREADKAVRQGSGGAHRRPKEMAGQPRLVLLPQPSAEETERFNREYEASAGPQTDIIDHAIEPPPIGDAERALLLATVRGEPPAPFPGLPGQAAAADDPSLTAWTRDQAAELDRQIAAMIARTDGIIEQIEGGR